MPIIKPNTYRSIHNTQFRSAASNRPISHWQLKVYLKSNIKAKRVKLY